MACVCPKFSDKQLQKKYKHAKDFGVSENYTKGNADKFKESIINHLNDVETKEFGTYLPEKGSKVYFNPNTNNVVVLDTSDNFVTGFKLDPGASTNQYNNYINNGVLR